MRGMVGGTPSAPYQVEDAIVVAVANRESKDDERIVAQSTYPPTVPGFDARVYKKKYAARSLVPHHLSEQQSFMVQWRDDPFFQAKINAYIDANGEDVDDDDDDDDEDSDEEDEEDGEDEQPSKLQKTEDSDEEDDDE